MDQQQQQQQDHDPRRSNSFNGQNIDSADHNGIPRLKRTACILCRRRKLRCDQIRPKCGTCERLGHECQYDEGGRKKSGPKRGYVKALEQRLAQVETMLKTQEIPDFPLADDNNVYDVDLGISDPLPGPGLEELTAGQIHVQRRGTSNMPVLSPDQSASHNGSPQAQNQHSNTSASDFQNDFTFDMIALGLEEPLPTQDIVNDLNALYFDKAHMTMPMIHKARYYAAMDLAPNMRPPVCLRYAMWACAAGVSSKYEALAPHFYQRARKYLEHDEMRDFGQAILTLSHCQTWILVTMYEFKNMFFPRAWMSTGRATRLAQMLGLHRVDGMGLDVKQTMPAPRDWTEQEERRRTFWMAYWCDRCASIGTGWPMSIEEKDILTNLPATEDEFQQCRAAKTTTLQASLESVDQNLSSTAGATLMSTLFGRNLMHLHRAEPDDNEEDLNGKFWQRHRWIDNTLLNITLSLPEHLRLPYGMMDPNVVFLNMCLHSSTICLHQAAIFKADKHRLPAHISGESKIRCITAATSIASIMRSVCHMDNTTMNPFTSFCLYVSARVFVQYLKARPGDQQSLSSLTFLLTAMHSMKRRAAITESFIAQLELDMEAAKVANPYTAKRAQEEDLSAMPYPAHGVFANDGSTAFAEDRPNRLNISVPGMTKGPVNPCAQSAGVLPMSSSINMESQQRSADVGPANQYGPPGGPLSGQKVMLISRMRPDKSSTFDGMFDGDAPRFQSQVVEMDTSPDSTSMGATGESQVRSTGGSRANSTTTGMTSPLPDRTGTTPDTTDKTNKSSAGQPMHHFGNPPRASQSMPGFGASTYFETYGPSTHQQAPAAGSSAQQSQQQPQHHQQQALHGADGMGGHDAFPAGGGFDFSSMPFSPSATLGQEWDQNAGMTPGTQAWTEMMDNMGNTGSLWEATATTHMGGMGTAGRQ